MARSQYRSSILAALIATLFTSIPVFAEDEPVTTAKTEDVAKTDEVGPLIPYRTTHSKVGLLIPYRTREAAKRSPASASR